MCVCTKKERTREKGEMVMVSLQWGKEASTVSVFILLTLLFSLHFLTLSVNHIYACIFVFNDNQTYPDNNIM